MEVKKKRHWWKWLLAVFFLIVILAVAGILIAERAIERYVMDTYSLSSDAKLLSGRLILDGNSVSRELFNGEVHVRGLEIHVSVMKIIPFLMNRSSTHDLPVEIIVSDLWNTDIDHEEMVIQNLRMAYVFDTSFVTLTSGDETSILMDLLSSSVSAGSVAYRMNGDTPMEVKLEDVQGDFNLSEHKITTSFSKGYIVSDSNYQGMDHGEVSMGNLSVEIDIPEEYTSIGHYLANADSSGKLFFKDYSLIIENLMTRVISDDVDFTLSLGGCSFGFQTRQGTVSFLPLDTMDIGEGGVGRYTVTLSSLQMQSPQFDDIFGELQQTFPPVLQAITGILVEDIKAMFTSIQELDVAWDATVSGFPLIDSESFSFDINKFSTAPLSFSGALKMEDYGDDVWLKIDVEQLKPSIRMLLEFAVPMMDGGASLPNTERFSVDMRVLHGGEPVVSISPLP
ncbi:hypothetical protein [Parasphaerochaeta coccoides]|uniref:Uncharacterized protein n=1 Tax=Parasphaerochaeta coccoides (strain ATCC BAA-1237 / DSM 17374 / SPN1) TaxID=760011 RepID=F4GHI9_PARC1|nr:hypothetical protein [Parasphaerochaeta coccoides]AEC02578.1 hypothetical protein Spico_1373 [Parasphaerochaeta coccoides DSM 17374]